MTSNAYRWGVRKPNQEGHRCDECGEVFYTNRSDKRFCCAEHSKAYWSKRQKQTIHRLKKAASLAYGGGATTVAPPPELRYAALGEDMPDYARYSELGLDDGTPEVVELLKKRTVWAKHADLDPPRRPFEEMLTLLDIRSVAAHEGETLPRAIFVFSQEI